MAGAGVAGAGAGVEGAGVEGAGVEGAGAGVAAAPEIVSTCPTRRKLGLVIPFRVIRFLVVVPKRDAIPLKVSLATTVYEVGAAGAGAGVVGAGATGAGAGAAGAASAESLIT